MKKFSDDELIKEIVRRKLVFQVADKLSDDDVCEIVRDRDLEDNFDESDEEEERDRIYDEVDASWQESHHVLPKFFDRFQLRDHLLDIAGLQSHNSDRKLFDKLQDLLEYS